MLKLEFMSKNAVILACDGRRMELTYERIAGRPFLIFHVPATACIYVPLQVKEFVYFALAGEPITILPARLGPTAARMGFQARHCVEIHREQRPAARHFPAGDAVGPASPAQASGKMPHVLEST